MRRRVDAGRGGAAPAGPGRGRGRLRGARGARWRCRAAFVTAWREFADDHDGLVERLARACDELAAACDRTAVEVEYAKIQYIAALVVLGATIASLVATIWAGGVSAAGIPVAVAAAQVTIRLVLMRLLTGVVLGAGVNVAIDLVAQSIQRSRSPRRLGLVVDGPGCPGRCRIRRGRWRRRPRRRAARTGSAGHAGRPARRGRRDRAGRRHRRATRPRRAADRARCAARDDFRARRWPRPGSAAGPRRPRAGVGRDRGAGPCATAARWRRASGPPGRWCPRPRLRHRRCRAQHRRPYRRRAGTGRQRGPGGVLAPSGRRGTGVGVVSGVAVASDRWPGTGRGAAAVGWVATRGAPGRAAPRGSARGCVGPLAARAGTGGSRHRRVRPGGSPADGAAGIRATRRGAGCATAGSAGAVCRRPG